jgi:hypothetical protein
VQRARSRDGSLPAATRRRVEGSGGEAEERLVASWRPGDDRTSASDPKKDLLVKNAGSFSCCRSAGG